MSSNNFITQARIDDEKFSQIVQRCRNMRTEMNLQYCKLRRKTFSSIYSLPKEACGNASTTSPHKSPMRSTYTPSNKKFYANENNEKKKDHNIFVVTTVKVKAKMPDQPQVKLDPVKKKQNPIKVPKVRSIQSRNDLYRK
ncbi:hypothetical protein M9Y10_044204 [Tritrichomonas musculus]|uniref:Uncharacterized protein n=1 Tax=Tritrichomonas musculus TaxID=1915356 RepID=A0ABR2K1S8_9EUKA